LLPELVRARGDQVWSFGRGLAQGAVDPVAAWKQLIDQLEITLGEAASLVVFCGFLSALHQKNQMLAGSLLDEAIEDDLLREWYPVLEAAAGTIDALGLRRLIRSLELGRAPIRSYRALVGGGVTQGLIGRDFNNLLLRISDRPEGVDVAMEILFMRLSFNRESSSPDELGEIGCELLRRLKVTGGIDPNLAYKLQIVGKHCLTGDEGVATVREVCAKLRDTISRSEASVYGHREFLQVLFNAQPLAVLQSLCSGDAAMVKIGVRVLENSDLLNPHTFGVIPEEELIRWCDELPDVRYPIAAGGIAAIRRDTDGPQWTDIARRTIEKSPDRVQVLRKFIRQFRLPAWDAPPSENAQSDLRLLDDMATHTDPEVAEFAKNEKARLLQTIAASKEISPPYHMGLDEGFE
jgi:hypothetical protein